MYVLRRNTQIGRIDAGANKVTTAHIDKVRACAAALIGERMRPGRGIGCPAFHQRIKVERIIRIGIGHRRQQGLGVRMQGILKQDFARRDLDAYHAANLEFHDALVALARNAKLLATYRRLVNELHLYRRATLARAGALPVSVREHHDILDKIAAKDAAGAGAALHEHALRSRRHMHLTRHDAAPAAKPVRLRRKR